MEVQVSIYKVHSWLLHALLLRVIISELAIVLLKWFLIKIVLQHHQYILIEIMDICRRKQNTVNVSVVSQPVAAIPYCSQVR